MIGPASSAVRRPSASRRRTPSSASSVIVGLRRVGTRVVSDAGSGRLGCRRAERLAAVERLEPAPASATSISPRSRERRMRESGVLVGSRDRAVAWRSWRVGAGSSASIAPRRWRGRSGGSARGGAGGAAGSAASARHRDRTDHVQVAGHRAERHQRAGRPDRRASGGRGRPRCGRRAPSAGHRTSSSSRSGRRRRVRAGRRR